jgi:hypothetical protein
VTKPVACDWSEDDEGCYVTGCGHAFALNDGTPHENQMLYCPFCGRRIKERAPREVR